MNSFNAVFVQQKKALIGLIAALFLGLGGTVAMAQDSLKIAVLDMNSALFNSEVAKVETQKIRDETAADEQKVRSLADQATALNDRLQKDGAVMSEDERRKVAGEIEELGVQYEFLVQKLQRLMQERQQAFQQAYTPNLVEAITAVIEEDGYDLVFRSEAVLHYNPGNDITARVTAKLNEQE